MAGGEHDSPSTTLAQRLDLLFKTAHAAGQDEDSYQDVAEAIAHAGGPTVTSTYLYMLRTGRRANPSVRLLQALARYFKVPVAYFLDEAVADELSSQLRLLSAIRDSDIQQLALRSHGLSPESRAALAALIERLRAAEGLPNDETS